MITAKLLIIKLYTIYYENILSKHLFNKKQVIDYLNQKNCFPLCKIYFLS